MGVAKKKMGAPKKDEDEIQVPFSVSCKKKNIDVIKPKVKKYIKKLDK